MEKVHNGEWYLYALFFEIDCFWQRISAKEQTTLISPQVLKNALGIPEVLPATITEKLEMAAALSLGCNLATYQTQRKRLNQKMYLLPILERLGSAQGENKYKKIFQPFSISMEKMNFPQDQQEANSNLIADTWRHFSEAIMDHMQKNKGQDRIILAENVLYIFQHHTSFIPTYFFTPTISYYHHSKTLAAFATCDSTKYLLVGADMSGVQNFIYDIISKNAAKNLKGRSFYLQLLVENVCQEILDELNLFRCHVVYASGGGFYLIAPDTEEVVKTLRRIEVELSKKILETHSTRLYLSLGYTSFEAEELLQEDGLNAIRNRLANQISQKKSRRYATAIKASNVFQSFFEPSDVGGLQMRDAITNDEFKKGESPSYLDDQNTLAVRPVTMQQIELGKRLKRADFWWSSREKLLGNRLMALRPCQLNYEHLIAVKDKKVKTTNGLMRKISINKLPQQNSADLNTIQGFTFYGGNDFPTEIATDNQEVALPKEFSQLAGDGKFKRIGVLRMDVDNLGERFLSGIEASKRTFSNLSTLSGQLDLFFKGYLNKIWKDQYQDDTMILYSGGDDLFIVGRWDRTIQFARDIRNAFSTWTADNPMLSLSGGIVIVSPKFPIAQSALLAAKAEKKAKNYRYKDQTKNAFTLLGKALSWEHDFILVEQVKNRLNHFIQKGTLSKNFLGHIMQYAAEREEEIAQDKTERWRWMLIYYLAQTRSKMNKELIAEKQFIDELKDSVFSDSHLWENTNTRQSLKSPYCFLELLALAARWANLERRSNETE